MANWEDDGFQATSAPFVIPTDDAGIVRRVKGIVVSAPINDLQRNRSSFQGDYWTAYDLVALSAGVIDQVALAMGVASGMPYDVALDSIKREAARQQPGGDDAQWANVAEKVLAALVSDAQHTHAYIDHTDNNQRRIHEFRLLYEEYRADGTTDLRATAAAINVLVDALDIDVESAQIASEAQMRALIQRGALDSAVNVAQRARYQSIQYLENVRTITRDTLVDPDSHDWNDAVPTMLDGALDHIEERVSAELELRTAVEQRRSETVDAEMRTFANRLIMVLKDCTMRHTELQRHLMQIRSQLRQAQDDRFSRPVHLRSRFDLERDLLTRAFRTPAVALVDWSEQLLNRFTAPRRLYQPSIARLLDELAEVTPDGGAGEPIVEPEFDFDTAEVWWTKYWDLAEEIVESITEATRLSSVLTQLPDIIAAQPADADGERLDEHTLASAVCHLAYARTAASLNPGGGVTTVLCAAPDGTPIDTQAILGDNLWITEGHLGDPSAGTPSAHIRLEAALAAAEHNTREQQ